MLRRILSPDSNYNLDVSQKTKVFVYHYPFAEKMNPGWHKIILEEATTRDKGASMTGWHCFDQFKLIGDYALDLIKNLAPLQCHSLRLYQIWGQVYNKGDYQCSHEHIPYHWSFVYCVNAPKGSAPLVFDDTNKKVFFKSGDIVIFPSWIKHHVPKNKCEERTIIAGNVIYEEQFV